MLSTHNFRVVINSMRLCHWSQFNKEDVHLTSNWLFAKMGGALNCIYDSSPSLKDDTVVGF